MALPDTGATEENTKQMRTLLASVDFDKLVAAADPSVAQRGYFLFVTARVRSIRWTEGGTVLEAEFAGDTDTYTVGLRAEAKTGRLSVACDCPYFRHHGDLCKHLVATLHTIHALFRQEFPDSLFATGTYWARLTRQLFEDNSAPTTGPLVAINLDAPPGHRNFLYYHRPGKPLEYWEEPPPEVAGFANRLHPIERQAERFYSWFSRPSRIAVEVVHDNKRRSVERHRPVLLEAATEIDFSQNAVTFQRKLRTAGHTKTKAPEPAAPIGNRLLWLKDGRFGWIDAAVDSEVWTNGAPYIREMLALTGLPEYRAVEEDPDAELRLSPDSWNRLNFPWPLTPHKARAKRPPLRVAGLPATAAGQTPEFVFNIRSEGNEVEVHVEMNAAGEKLWHADRVFESAATRGWRYQGGFDRSEARVQALERSVIRCIAADSEEERKNVERALKEDPLVSRIRAGKRTVSQVFHDIRRIWPLKEPDTLHVSRSEECWFAVREGCRTAAKAIAIALDLLPEAHVSCDGESYYLSTDTKTFMQAVPDLTDRCAETKIALTFDNQPIEPIDLDISVRAVPEDEKLDWFALVPEVLADGSLIPQDKWEAWMRGGILRDANGKFRVVTGKSLNALRKLSAVVELHTSEAGGGKRGKDKGVLRVPRLRIFDWLDLRQSGVRCDLPPEAAKIVDSLAAFRALPAATVPKPVTAKLRPYQKEGYIWLAFLYRHRFGACLADDMGLGKTVQTIALLAATRHGGLAKSNGRSSRSRLPHLVVLPPTLLFNWRHEIETFCPSLSVEEYTGPDRDIVSIDADVILTTYELARRDIETLENCTFDTIVFDEAQAIKNLTGERSKAMRRLKGRFKLCLTGTPLENHAGEYYSILELALPGLFGDYRRFMATLDDIGAFRPIDRARPFVLRRTKEKILKELPPKTESDVWLDLTEIQKQFYTRAVAEVREEVFRAFRDKTAQQAGIVALSALTRLRQICISPALIDPDHTELPPKTEYLLDKLDELHEEGHAALIFSQFTRALDLQEKELKKRKIDYLRIDGSTPQATRKVRVAAFQKSDGPPFFLISLRTGGVGLNLTRASYVFHLDPWWNPAVENQASDRAHRIGQKQRVFVNRLLMRHTVEEKMMLLKKRKRALFDHVLSGAENRKGASLLTREDMAWLLDE